MLPYFAIAAGALLLWKGVVALTEGFKKDALYEEARINRVRIANHDGDTSQI